MRGWLNQAHLQRPVRPHRTSELGLKLGDIPGHRHRPFWATARRFSVDHPSAALSLNLSLRNCGSTGVG
jgi:hypothetical protein